MPSLKVTVNVELDGAPIVGYPLVRRIEVDELQGFDYTQETNSDPTVFIGVPADLVSTIQALIMRVDQAVNLRLNGQSDAGITLNPGGIIVLLDATINAGNGPPNAQVSNASGDPVVIRGLAGGD